MIKHSTAYDSAVVADSRKQVVRAVFDLIDPDAVIEGFSSNDESPFSLTSQIIKRANEESEQNVATLEQNRWLLDGSFILPTKEREGQVGWESNTICNANCEFEVAPYVELNVSGVDVLQAVTLSFPTKAHDGYPQEFTISIYSGATLADEKTISNNTQTTLIVDGLNAYYPTKVRLTIHKWSLPYRRVRTLHFFMGIHETWDTKIIKSVDIYTEVTFSGLSLPYSSCTISVYNENHRFDPYAPNSIFRSIEERQAIKVELGMRIEDGGYEWTPAGTYFQQSGGWTLQDLTVQWQLVDVIGMLVNRRFVLPAVLPTTLGGWIEAITSSLGVNFRTFFSVDPDVAVIPLTAYADKVEGKFCGELLRFACMATNTWPRQDVETGFLRIGKLERVEGNRITLDNMSNFPVMSANNEVADITFTLDDGSVTFAGTNTESDVSLSVDNPFVHTADDARKAVLSCLLEYGGRRFQAMHRGNPTSEVGDLQTVDTQFRTTVTARTYKQQLKLDNGVMLNVPSFLVQSPNDTIYKNRVVLTGSGTWIAPATTTELKVTMIGGGFGGQGGGGGVWIWDSFTPDKRDGSAPGSGGKVSVILFTANASQSVVYACGKGGAGGAGGTVDADGQMGGVGTDTSFGSFTSANGLFYENGLMDIQSGAVYAAKGASGVLASYGSGGAGGVQGRDGRIVTVEKEEEDGDFVHETSTVAYATDGTAGASGLDGCIIVEW